MANVDWDTFYMSMCDLVAMKSKDKSTNYGAVIIGPDKEVRSTGYNGFCRGLDDTNKDRQQRPEKYFWFEHAERNGIYNAARMGTPLKGCTLYINGIPCMDCGRAIVQSGISEVVMDDRDLEKLGSTIWDASHARVYTLFDECGVTYRIFNKTFNKIDILMLGEKRVR